MKNSEIAKVFEDIADMLELKGENVFKVRAYQKVSRSIEHLPVGVEQMAAEDRLDEIKGVGEAIASKITELVTTGRLKYYEDLKSEFPPGISTLLTIPSVGPKTAMLLSRELGINSIDELEQAIRSGKVAELPRMGEKTAENILRNIEALRRKKREQRIPLGAALPVAEEVVAGLKGVPGLKNLVPAGSLRRFRDTIGDIDIIGTADKPAAVMDAFTALPQVGQVISKGTTKASLIFSNDLQVDLRILDHDSFGSSLQHFTGSKQHNIALRERAQRMGLSLSEYGITVMKTDKLEKFATEEAFYARQGLAWIPPEIREATQEIARAEKGTLPRLVELSDIKGDFHVHTDWSDGNESIEKMALAAKDLGYEYIGISDHSAGLGVARGLDAQRRRRQIEEIRELSRKLGIHILAGIEVDIRANGALDAPDEILAEVDFVIAAVHSGMSQSEYQMTKRVIKAIENPNVDILAHPTGRLLGSREPVAIDIEAVFEAAARNKTALEINAMPDRLDLKDTHAYRARELGIRIAICTDAHRHEHLKNTRFGVGVARRAWCEAGDILNTMPFSKLTGYLKQRKKG